VFVKRLLVRVDTFQQRHRALALPYAVHKRFAEDRGPHYSALIAYYGFFSIFPLLLAFVSVLAIVLRHHQTLEQRLIDSAFGKFPVIGTDLSNNVKSLNGSAFAVAVGLVLAIWAGLKGVQAAQHAMDTMWRVPFEERPNFLRRRLRAFIMLMVLGGGTIASTGIASISAQLSGLPQVARFATGLGTFAVNVGLLLLSFRLLTVARHSVKIVLPGALAGAVALLMVQVLGSWYVARVLTGASDTYGTFAVVIGLLTWVALQARIVLYAAELNVVLALRLWPRSFDRVDAFTTDRF
jgi:YihY family inner membrane protein